MIGSEAVSGNSGSLELSVGSLMSVKEALLGKTCLFKPDRSILGFISIGGGLKGEDAGLLGTDGGLYLRKAGFPSVCSFSRTESSEAIDLCGGSGVLGTFNGFLGREGFCGLGLIFGVRLLSS